jgi:hypothetical protein
MKWQIRLLVSEINADQICIFVCLFFVLAAEYLRGNYFQLN